MRDIKIWHIGNGKYYVKVPYINRGIMAGKYVVMTYTKDGKWKYLQYELTKEEVERLINNGTLNQRKSKNNKQFQKAV